jgi:uncharacterized OsmC-like protein
VEPFVREVRRLRAEAPCWGKGDYLERHSVRAEQNRALAVAVHASSGHRFTVDEPEWFGGDGEGPNPAEAALGAVAASLAVTARVYAALMGIALERTVTEVIGFLDLRGFIEPSGHRAGFESICVRMRLVPRDPGVPDDVSLDQLRKAIVHCCPILDALRRPPEIDFSFSA